MAPLPKEYVSPWRKKESGRTDGDSDLIDWNYETTENYLQMIDNVKPGLNECYLGAARQYQNGGDGSRKPSSKR